MIKCDTWREMAELTYFIYTLTHQLSDITYKFEEEEKSMSMSDKEKAHDEIAEDIHEGRFFSKRPDLFFLVPVLEKSLHFDFIHNIEALELLAQYRMLKEQQAISSDLIMSGKLDDNILDKVSKPLTVIFPETGND